MTSVETYRAVEFMVGATSALLTAIHLGAGAYIFLEVVTHKRNGISVYLGTYVSLVGLILLWMSGQGVTEGFGFNDVYTLVTAGISLLVIYIGLIYTIYKLVRKLLSESANSPSNKGPST